MQSADILKIEESIFQKWQKEKTREAVNSGNKGNKVFFFLEGPPYSNGELHLGHVRGYVRKDAVLRYRRMRGYDVFDRAGFDVHGLPIENKVERQLGITSKKDIEATTGIANFVDNCIKLYKNYVSMQVGDAQRFGVWFDFENAYIPATPEYINKSFMVFKKIYEKNFVYKDIKVMPYCIHCGTVLAKGPEVEEEEDTDPSVFVLFRINAKASKPRIKLGEDAYLLVWTTTPWTLPANMAVAVNPKEKYVRVKVDDKELIVAKDRLESVSGQFKASGIVIDEFYGSDLEGVHYISPLEQFIPKQKELRKHHRVIFSEELVNMGEGTGLVHIAPAYGPEDFALAKKEKIPLLSLVSTDGKYTADSGKYEGKTLIHEANREVEKDLEAVGALLWKATITHNYPHCWRCHEKLIFLPTEQWFINVSKMKNRIKKQCEKIEWHPPELKDWFIESIDAAPDWVISRQRYWGIPIPMWICDSCKETEVIGSFEELKSRSEKAKFTSEDLHRPLIDGIVLKCAKCGGEMHRIKDIFDVWYDSGVAHTASLSDEEFKAMFPKAYITEGPDQLRGWFATLMKTSVAAYGKSPFKTICMQGWVVDAKGEQMHKSKGNYLSARDLLSKYSVDAVRAFTLSHVTHENLKFMHVEIEEMQSMLLLLHNISNLVSEYSNAIGYRPDRIKSAKSLDRSDMYDAWIISRLNTTIKEMTDAMEGFEINRGLNHATNFVINDFSRFYLKIAKKRITESSKRDARKTLDVINYCLFNTLLLLAPITPFNTEKIYLENYKKKESIFLEKWPKFNEALIDAPLEKDFEIATGAITATLSSREKAGLRLRWPIRKATIEVTDDSAYSAIERLESVIEDYANVKQVVIKRVEGLTQEIRPLFQKIGPEFKENAGMVAEELKRVKPAEINESINKSGHFVLHTSKGNFNIGPEHFFIVQKSEESDAVTFRHGRVQVDKEVDKELVEEGMVREFERRVQLARKEKALRKGDLMDLSYEASPNFADIIRRNADKIKKDVGAKTLREGLGKESSAKLEEIEDEKLRVEIGKSE